MTQDSSGHRTLTPSFNNVPNFLVSNVRSKSRRPDFMKSQPVLLGTKQSSKRRHHSTESRSFRRTTGSKPRRRPRPKTPTADKRAKSAHEKRDSGWNQSQTLPKTYELIRHTWNCQCRTCGVLIRRPDVFTALERSSWSNNFLKILLH